MANGISKRGERAEKRFRELTGATKPRKASQGDAEFEDGSLCEVKKTSKTTCNQMRADKGIPHTVWNEDVGAWSVISPERLIQDAALKTRGQHGESPFENCTVNVQQYSDCTVTEERLADAVKDAFWNYREQHSELAAIMEKHLQNRRKETARAREEVMRYFERRGEV